MERFDGISLDIEFLLISVVQGVALSTLALGAAPLLGDLRFETFLYILTSFVLILSFWSQAIIHAISFIDWPIDLPHSFLYFLASFMEVVAFAYLNNPVKWFLFMGVFFLVVVILYAVDLGMIKERRGKFETKKQVKLYEHVISEQTFEFKTFLPAAVIFCFVSAFIIGKFPNLFITQHWHLGLISFQAIFSIYVLLTSFKSYKKRAKLLTEANS